MTRPAITKHSTMGEVLEALRSAGSQTEAHGCGMGDVLQGADDPRRQRRRCRAGRGPALGPEPHVRRRPARARDVVMGQHPVRPVELTDPKGEHP
jgi:hypothetical protein